MNAPNIQTELTWTEKDFTVNHQILSNCLVEIWKKELVKNFFIFRRAHLGR